MKSGKLYRSVRERWKGQRWMALLLTLTGVPPGALRNLQTGVWSSVRTDGGPANPVGCHNADRARPRCPKKCEGEGGHTGQDATPQKCRPKNHVAYDALVLLLHTALGDKDANTTISPAT